MIVLIAAVSKNGSIVLKGKDGCIMSENIKSVAPSYLPDIDDKVDLAMSFVP